MSVERVPPTGECFVSSQTYKDLVECADDAAALREIGSDLQWISKNCRIVTKRGGYADDCAEECLIYHFVVVNDPREYWARGKGPLTTGGHRPWRPEASSNPRLKRT